ncbi:MAG: 50S ribosomal protein L1 [Bacilli bacterium]|jgi:large subunit ribosomal protein L1|nr:50S ribosomal protein L1 [Bacilli bacterium]
MKKKGKKYLRISEKIEPGQLYSKEEALNLVKEFNVYNFDQTVDVAISLNVDVRKADQQVRGAVTLPNGVGKTKKVLVITQSDKAQEAKEAGADYVGDTDIINKIETEKWFDYDVIVATPNMMPLLGKLGKILGPKGLMPNPKTNTVTNEIAKVVKEIKTGRVEYRTDNGGNIHGVIGKLSFDNEKLLENLNVLVKEIKRVKPATVKGNYIKGVVISTSQGPGIKINPNSFDK